MRFGMRATTDRINELAGIIDAVARHLGEGTVTITPTAITMKGLDKAHVVYIETVIYNTFFTEYQADEEERIGLRRRTPRRPNNPPVQGLQVGGGLRNHSRRGTG